MYCTAFSVLMMWQVHTACAPLYWWCTSILMVWHICTKYLPPYWWYAPSILNTLHHTANSLFRVSLLYSDETFMCMHAQEVFISNKIYKKACTVLNRTSLLKFHFICLEKITWNSNSNWWDSNSQPLGYKPSAPAIQLTSSKAIAGKELSLSSWCIAS